ncbi:MAG: hypothetical protein QF400_04795, partial [Candidatus Peribacteraceae bacterium]|nr:hypothetical protein [Candidatus Peribacteraceae bacterium]
SITSGSGTPENVVSSTVGSLFMDRTSGALYRKSTGSSNTGWENVTQNASFGTGNVMTMLTNDANPRFIESAGDTMTGNLVLQSANLTATGVLATGAMSASGSLSVDGLTYLNNNTVITGTLNTSSNIAGSGSLSVDGLAYLNANTVITGTLNTTSNIAGSGTLSIEGNISSSGTLVIDGVTSLKGAVTIGT